MCSLTAVYFQKSIFWKTEEILLNIDFLFKCQMLWTFHLLITFQTDAWNKILGFPTSKIFPLHLCSYSLSSHSLHQYLNFCPPTCIQKYIHLISTTFTILLEVLHFIYHYLLWFIIFSSSVMISELQEICCKPNACTVLTTALQEREQPQRHNRMDIHLHVLCCSWCWYVTES